MIAVGVALLLVFAGVELLLLEGFKWLVDEDHPWLGLAVWAGGLVGLIGGAAVTGKALYG